MGSGLGVGQIDIPESDVKCRAYPTDELLKSDEVLVQQRGAGSGRRQIKPPSAVLGAVGIIWQ